MTRSERVEQVDDRPVPRPPPMWTVAHENAEDGTTIILQTDDPGEALHTAREAALEAECWQRAWCGCSQDRWTVAESANVSTDPATVDWPAISGDQRWWERHDWDGERALTGLHVLVTELDGSHAGESALHWYGDKAHADAARHVVDHVLHEWRAMCDRHLERVSDPDCYDDPGDRAGEVEAARDPDGLPDSFRVYIFGGLEMTEARFEIDAGASLTDAMPDAVSARGAT